MSARARWLPISARPLRGGPLLDTAGLAVAHLRWQVWTLSALRHRKWLGRMRAELLRTQPHLDGPSADAVLWRFLGRVAQGDGNASPETRGKAVELLADAGREDAKHVGTRAMPEVVASVAGAGRSRVMAHLEREVRRSGRLAELPAVIPSVAGARSWSWENYRR